MATDMECAAIFIVAAARHLRASGIPLCVNAPPYSVKPLITRRRRVET